MNPDLATASSMMPDAGMVSFLVLAAGVFAGALVCSFAGFALAPVAGVLLLAVYPPAIVIPLLMICSVLVQVAMLVHCRRSLQWRGTGPMLTGGIGGVAVAVAIFPAIDARSFQIGFGLFLAAYAAAMLARPNARPGLRSTPRRDATVGVLGGLIGGLTAMPGAAPVLYCDLRGVPKGAQRAIVQPFILVMQLVALALFAAAGGLDRAVGGLVALSLPALGLGTVVGLGLFGRVPDAGFRKVVLGVLLVTGLALALQPSRPVLARSSVEPAGKADRRHRSGQSSPSHTPAAGDRHSGSDPAGPPL